jgi:uncharacterized OsmC-like protein
MSMTQQQIETIRQGVRVREETQDPARMRGLDRIEIQVNEGLSYTASAVGEDGAMAIGEPVARGGTGEGNSPLAHFLTGASSCLLNQFVRLAIADGLDLRFTGARVRGEFRRDIGGAFERITTEVLAEGSLAEGAAAALLERAEAFCYVHNTLNRSVRMTTVLLVDGQEAARNVSGPDV